MNTPVPGILFALDAPWPKRTLEAFIVQISPHVSGYKIGKILIATGRSTATAEFIRHNCPHHIILWDNKDDDVASTLVTYVDVLRRSGLFDMFTVHADTNIAKIIEMARVSGEMLMLVVAELSDSTSTKEYMRERLQSIIQLTRPMTGLARRASGIICAPRDLKLINPKLLNRHDFLLVTPGVRKSNTRARFGDFRSATPSQIVKQARQGIPAPDYVVIGRAIYRDDDPVVAAKRIREVLQRHSVHKTNA